MKRFWVWMSVVACMCGPSAFAERCEEIAGLKLAHVTITRAEVVRTGSFALESGAPLTGLPAFCRVAASIRPVADSDIRIELWMPLTGWNERLEGTGNGGLAGKIGYGALAGGVKLGYAVVNTDMGMATPPGQDAGVFVGRPERWADWGYRATHEMTVVARELVKAYYERDAKHAYFVGCSTGGEQALMEAQRFPLDYDGIVGGAPAHNRTGVHLSILWNFAEVERVPGAYLPAGKRELLAGAVVKACGGPDGLIADPRACRFDPGTIACREGNGADCLTPPQVNAVRTLYAGPADPRTGRQLYPGAPRGSEPGWGGFGAEPAAGLKAPYAPIFEWVFGPEWDWRKFDFDHDVDTYQKKLAGTLNATNPDLDRFRAVGHKLLLYQGWADWLVVPGETVRYFDAVSARDRTRGQATGDSVRMFMVPGMAHCGGGPVPTTIDPLAAMVRWVEDGAAPEKLAAKKVQPAGGSAAELTLCPYPAVPERTGFGLEPSACRGASGAVSGPEAGAPRR